MERLGKYELRGVLGRGASSTVYLAHDPFARRDVAIKVATPEILKHPEQGRIYSHLFINEASLAGKLNHPHIVQIYDAVVEENLAYIVMEFVGGGTLATYCTPETLQPLERVVEMVFKCTRALNFAVQLGITHRDIKPANILLADKDSGDIKVSDFGAAITGETDRTVVSGIGSPAYMSPQQVREEPLDQRTDIYSLGVVMYQLLTGQLPYQASSQYNMIYQIIHAQPTPPSHLRPNLPQRLEEIVLRAMAKDLAHRYANWEEFAHDLATAFRETHARPAEQHAFADSEKFSTLRTLPFFMAFSDAELWEVLRFSGWERVRSGQQILRDGERGDTFYFLAEGSLKVSKHNRTLNLLRPGDCFGEMAIISHGAHLRGADVVAMVDSKVISIGEQALHSASETCRMHFYQAFLDVLGGRLALANARLAAL